MYNSDTFELVHFSPLPQIFYSDHLSIEDYGDLNKHSKTQRNSLSEGENTTDLEIKALHCKRDFTTPLKQLPV